MTNINKATSITDYKSLSMLIFLKSAITILFITALEMILNEATTNNFQEGTSIYSFPWFLKQETENTETMTYSPKFLKKETRNSTLK